MTFDPARYVNTLETAGYQVYLVDEPNGHRGIYEINPERSRTPAEWVAVLEQFRLRQADKRNGNLLAEYLLESGRLYNPEVAS